MGDRAAARQLLPRHERQASILRAAATAFARGGFAGTSMDDVACEAGVSRIIVYRHFASKEELYRAVLDRVSDRLREEFLAGVLAADPQGFTTRALLTVAREDPDGFRLLVVHAAREPQFASVAAELREQAVQAADELIGNTIRDPALRSWITHTIVAYLYDSVLAWLDHGDQSYDDEFLRRATDGLVAMYGAMVQ